MKRTESTSPQVLNKTQPEEFPTLVEGLMALFSSASSAHLVGTREAQRREWADASRHRGRPP
jgi:hypothetical protein